MQNTMGGNMDIFKTLEKYESRSMHGQLPVVWSKAKNDTIWDINGKKYIDFTSGVGVACAGHNNPRVMAAIWAEDLYFSYTYPTENRAKYLEALCVYTGFDKAFLVSAGTQAAESACRLMRLYGMKTGRKVILSIKGSTHGKTALSQRLKHEDYDWTCINEGVKELKDENSITKDVCGVIIETYEGWSAKFHDKTFIQNVVEICKARDIIVCFDEIQAGFGRTGTFFGYKHYDIPEPDLICVGKGITSGVPCAGVLGRRDILDLPEPGSMTSSHSANPLACTAGLANLQEIQRILPFVSDKSKIMFDFLDSKFGKKYIVNGKGMVAGIITPTTDFATAVAVEAMNMGLLVIKTDRPSIKIMPPLTIELENLNSGLDILEECISSIERKI
jgi:4-aminobutyrate aminotransferase / (S)-3-amino-2-methylpropionate transaminase / 5-aminovalerate transaminase